MRGGVLLSSPSSKFGSSPPRRYLAATTATKHCALKLSDRGDNATRVPGVRRVDWCQTTFVSEHSVEKEIRQAGPVFASRYPWMRTFCSSANALRDKENETNLGVDIEFVSITLQWLFSEVFNSLPQQLGALEPVHGVLELQVRVLVKGILV